MDNKSNKFLFYYNYPYCAVFILDDTDYLGIDNDNIYIGTVDSELYGTGKSCEGYTEEIIESEEDIDKFFKDVFEIVYLSDKTKVYPKEEFIDIVKDKYRELAKELENSIER